MSSLLSPSSGTKAVSISDATEEINPTDQRAYRPSHLLRKSVSNKRLHGRLPMSPSLAASVVTRDVVPEVYLVEGQALEDTKSPLDHANQLLEKCAQWLDAAKKNPGGVDEASLDLLETLLQQRHTPTSRKHRRRRSLVAAAASDTEYASDGDAVVPGCEVWLKDPEEIGLDSFKLEVLKLAHTLRCKGWRRVDLERSGEVGVERISGALTNAVYVITPPVDVPFSTNNSSTTTLNTLENQNRDKDSAARITTRQPTKLLLRIYGPQVSHLIDRSVELYILRRLARQKIGPRLLGTFENGRFEQFFTARTLTKDDIRVPETSRHIAKRFKELHEGIELEPQERSQGPIVWKNWSKWLPRCNAVMKVVDSSTRPTGLVCGAPWPVFTAAVDRYRTWLVARYGSEAALNKELVFAHNDTQYGNILRLQASGKSPLLLPSNEHRQLIVIDFEYASANTPGFEFANHFCEWMADYHDPTAPHRMRTARFPTQNEMKNFVTAYVDHSLTGRVRDNTTPTTVGGVAAFMLDSRSPAPLEPERERHEEVDREVEHLLAEMRVWKAASSAMWCAWGVVQATVLEPAEEQQDDDEDFDYLLYAQQRALLFWGDCLTLGVFTLEELDEMYEGLGAMAKSV